MVAREKQEGHKYDFILRTRPDIEYGHSLREASVWATLPLDVIWVLGTVQTAGRHTKSVVKDGGFKILPVESIDYIDDYMKVLPRRLLKRYLGVSSPIQGPDAVCQ